MEPAATSISKLPRKKETIMVTSFTAKGPRRHTVSFPARTQSFREKLAGAHRKRGPEQQVPLRNHSLGLPWQKRSSSSKLLLSPSYIPRWLCCRVHKRHFGHSTCRRAEGNIAEIQLTIKEARPVLVSLQQAPTTSPQSIHAKAQAIASSLRSEPLAVTIWAVRNHTVQVSSSHYIHQKGRNASLHLGILQPQHGEATLAE